MSLTARALEGAGEATDSGTCVMLASAEDLARFKARLRRPGRLPPATIRLSIKVISVSDRTATEQRLNALYNDCGCTIGSLAAGTMAAANAVRLMAINRPLRLSDAFRSASTTAAAAVVGKIGALALRRAQIFHLITCLEGELTKYERLG